MLKEETERQRKKSLVGIAVGQYETRYVPRIFGDNYLTDGSTGIVADQCNVFETQNLDEIRDDTSHSFGCEIYILPHRHRMTS